jgi:sigma-B regulation protein RsbU (phosphoserine phosphatase)
MKLVDTTHYERLSDLVEALKDTCGSGDVDSSLAILRCVHESYGVDAFIEVDQVAADATQYSIALTGCVDDHGIPRIISPVAPSVFADGLLGSLVRTPEVKLATHVDCQTDPVLCNVFPCGKSLLAIPLTQGGGAHKWLIFLSRSAVGFTRSNMEQVAALAVAARKWQDSHDLHQQLEAIQKELLGHADRLAAVQEALLPKDLPSLPGFQAAVSHQPRQVVGGDWYGVVPFDRPKGQAARHVAIAVGDVCGHDVSSTVVMGIVLAILRCYRAIPASPADVMRHLNARLCEMSLPNGFTTAFLCFLSLDNLKLTYSIAGHPRPLVRNPDGTVRDLARAAGLPLGVCEEATWQDAEETLDPGSLLCLHTDGITDTAAPGGEPYGLEALMHILSTAAPDPRAVISSVVDDLGRHQAGSPQVDDRTLLIARVGALVTVNPAVSALHR